MLGVYYTDVHGCVSVCAVPNYQSGVCVFYGLWVLRARQGASVGGKGEHFKFKRRLSN